MSIRVGPVEPMANETFDWRLPASAGTGSAVVIAIVAAAVAILVEYLGVISER